MVAAIPSRAAFEASATIRSMTAMRFGLDQSR
jgi:hypothetical protein